MKVDWCAQCINKNLILQILRTEIAFSYIFILLKIFSPKLHLKIKLRKIGKLFLSECKANLKRSLSKKNKPKTTRSFGNKQSKKTKITLLYEKYKIIKLVKQKKFASQTRGLDRD